MRSVLCLFIFLCWSGIAQEEKKKEKVILKIYDVQEFTTSVKNYKLPRYEGNSEPLENPFSTKSEKKKAEQNPKVTLESMNQLIQNRIRPESWDPNLGTSVEERAGMLMVMQTPEVHQIISKLLKEFQGYTRQQVLVKGIILTTNKMPDPIRLTDKEMDKLILQSGVRVLTRPQLICQNGQRAHIRCGREHNCITEFDVSGGVRDPLIRTLLEGFTFEVKPALLPDKNYVELQVGIVFTKNCRLDRKKILTRPGTADPQSAPRNSSVETIKSEVPAIDRHQFSTQVRVRKGQWILAGTGRNDGNAQAKNLLFFVSAQDLSKDDQ